MSAPVKRVTATMRDRPRFGSRHVGCRFGTPWPFIAANGIYTGCFERPTEPVKTMRHRLNRGGDRHANAALHRIVLVRLRWRHPPTIDYVARRTAEGRSKREIIRCLKR